MTYHPIGEAPKDGRVLHVRLPTATPSRAMAYWDDEKAAWCFELSGRPIQPQPTEYRPPTVDEALQVLGQAAYGGLRRLEEDGLERFDGGVEAIASGPSADGQWLIVVPYGGRFYGVSVRELRA